MTDTIIIILLGALAGLRTYFNYNMLLITSNKPLLSLFNYINSDNNLVSNFFKVVPLFEKAKNMEAMGFKAYTNICCFTFYFVIIYFIYCLFS